MTKGRLWLIPTPIDEESPLEPKALALLQQAALDPLHHAVVVEDLKPARQRWTRWGLPRESIADFHQYNEHTKDAASAELLALLKKGVNVYLMSDGGLPAFCDPGVELVDLCHRSQIRVTASPFPHSVSLALALSGFAHRRYFFEGFLPQETQERERRLSTLLTSPEVLVLMETPYRVKKMLQELAGKAQELKGRQVLVAMNLGQAEERLWRGEASGLMALASDVAKPEMVLVISQRPSALNTQK